MVNHKYTLYRSFQLNVFILLLITLGLITAVQQNTIAGSKYTIKVYQHIDGYRDRMLGQYKGLSHVANHEGRRIPVPSAYNKCLTIESACTHKSYIMLVKRDDNTCRIAYLGNNTFAIMIQKDSSTYNPSQNRDFKGKSFYNEASSHYDFHGSC